MDTTTARRIIRAKWKDWADNLSRDSKSQASLALVEEFNTLLAQTKEHLPETGGFLPKTIDGSSPFNQVGLSGIPTVDLRAIAMQVATTIDAAYAS